MKVLQINVSYGQGSTGIIVRDLRQQCVKNGIECKVACLYSTEQNSDIYIMTDGIYNKIHAVMTRFEGKQGYYSGRATRKLIDFIKKNSPDVVHLHNLHSSYVNVPMLLNFLAESGVKVVVTHHDCWLFTGGCSHYTHSNCSKWLDKCGTCPQRYEEFPAYLRDCSNKILEDKRKLFGAIKELTSVGVSQWIADEAHKSVFGHARSIAIHSGIDTSFFIPIESQIRKELKLEGKFVILAPNNKWFLNQNKDILEFFSSHLSDNMVLLFFGPGKVNTDCLTDRMINIGFISSREKIRDLYCAGDVMMNCSREETLSLLNLEVQSCGTPVVTYSNTGVKETVDNKCGFAVENGNPVEAWNAILKIKENGKAVYSEACHNWVVKEYNNVINYQKYINLYRSI